MKSIAILILAALAVIQSFAQTKLDSSEFKSNQKKYKELVNEKTVTKSGLLTVHKTEEKYYFEIPSSLFGKEILVVNRLSKSGADMRDFFSGYAGDEINEDVMTFERGPGNKIFIRKISSSEYSKDSTMPMFMAVSKNNIQPISASFDIKATGPVTNNPVIDMTDFINGDNDLFFFDPGAKSELKLAQLIPDKSYTESVNTWPTNIEIKTVKTYGRAPRMTPGGPLGAGNSTVEINSSMVLLPEKPMQTRYADVRVGFFTVGYTDFDHNPQGTDRVFLIKRWRLEPKEEDRAKYERGELVEPKKPIIYYIDPATPKKWVPYLIKGINDWQAAFEKAGFKNAIMGKEAPTKDEDSTWSLEDARYSAIVYKPSPIANASGPSIADPRTGEILESHINWYHSIMELVQQWYFIQTANSDPRARRMQFDDELMGQLIRFVSSHEVGHTLGLLHNFGSSSTVPVDSLRDNKWVEANGHTPSIMDYARFNYVAQPEDHVSEKGLFPRIGDYDKWAIEWGYRLFSKYHSAEEEKIFINQWIIDHLKNKRLWFGSEQVPDDPRCQSEALGDDNIKASRYGIKNLQRIVPNLINWTATNAEGYANLDKMYKQVTELFSRFLGHVRRNIAGQYFTPKSIEEKGVVFETVPKLIQQQALDFLNKQIFQTPSWLLNKDIFDRTGGEPVDIIGKLQAATLNNLLSVNTINKLLRSESREGAKVFTAIDLFNGLNSYIWTELKSKATVTVFRRNLQKIYITNLVILAGLNKQQANANQQPNFPPPPDPMTSDASSLARGELKNLQTQLTAALPGIKDKMTRWHYQDCLERIRMAFLAK
jgi:hypothetical protein